MPTGSEFGTPNFPSAYTTARCRGPRGRRSRGDLREGKLSGVICTSSLELGIDIGFLDFVVQYNSPRQVSRLIQRVGRSGHKIGQTSKGLVITQDSDDTLEAMVLCRRSLLGLLEPMHPFKNAYDAAIHQIAGLLVETSSWKLDDLYELIRSAYPVLDPQH